MAKTESVGGVHPAAAATSSSRIARRCVAVLVGATLLVAAACGDDGDTATSGSSTAAAPSQTGSTATDDTGSGSTREPDASTTTTTAVDDDDGDGGDLAGERLEIYPYEGAEVAVVGVAFDDALNVRSAPGTDSPVAFELPPRETGLTATGHNRTLEGSGLWSEITSDERTGWVNTAFLAQPGQVIDVTSEVTAAPGMDPSADTMLDLGQAVAATRASDQPPSDVVVVQEPTEGDLAEITVDVIGMGDDAVAGERLHVFAEPAPAGGFTLRTVEATVLCLRGVTDDGLCV